MKKSKEKEQPAEKQEQKPRAEVPIKRPSSLPATRSTALETRDAFSAYMREIRRYPKYTREEEHELAVRYREKGDREAAYALVSSNLWLVVKLAKEYERSARNMLDLIQEGNIGLLEAVKNYDPYRGVRFPSYAVWWVKAFIVRYMIANLRIVKVGTTQAQRKLYFNLHKEKEKLERMGVYPGPKLLAEKLNVKESEVVEMQQRLGSPDLSVDAPLSEEDGGSLLGVLSSGGLSSEELVAKKQRAEFIQKNFDEFAETLKERDRYIFEKRMLQEDKATLQELSEELGISRERVRQIENRTKEKLQKFFSEKLAAANEELDLS
ncbi:RNA polymerase factor sigma-32 [bacterium]|nr:RNA polymerase factor sigma-32 [bacterium]